MPLLSTLPGDAFVPDLVSHAEVDPHDLSMHNSVLVSQALFFELLLQEHNLHGIYLVRWRDDLGSIDLILVRPLRIKAISVCW